MMNVLICGDIVPTKSNYYAFSNNINSIVDSRLLEMFSKSNYNIFNLETPLYDGNSPILKDGPNLKAPVDTLSGIKLIGFNLAAMGNNHILDHGQEGLKSTINELKKCNIDYVGAGFNKEDAKKTFFFSFANKTVGVYACVDHEFSLAGKDNGGANYFDPLFSLDHIYDSKKKCDYLIVLYHGSKEYYRYPTPETQIKCQRMIDKGADLVLCQHSHCVGCEEKYKGGTILYGQGNFLFDHGDNEFRDTGLIVSIDENFDVNYKFIVKNDNGVRLANQNESKNFFDDFYRRSDKIYNSTFINDNYDTFCKDIEEMYIRPFIQMSFLQKVLNKLSHGRYLKKLASNKEKKFIRYENYMRCEAHREVWINCLKRYCQGDKSV